MSAKQKVDIHLLRDLCKECVDPVFEGQTVTLVHQSFDKNAETNFHAKNDNSRFYSVGEVVHFFYSKADSHAKYIAEARAQKVGYVRIEDKEELSRFFESGESLTPLPEKRPAEAVWAPKPFRVSYDFQDPDTSALESVDCAVSLSDEAVLLFKKLFAMAGKRQTKVRSGQIGPILIVPGLPSLPLNTQTVSAALLAGEFVSESKLGEVEQKKTKVDPAQPLRLRKKSQLRKDTQVFFTVRDSMMHMKKEDINRVVCVFAVGESWQFSQWPVSETEVLSQQLVLCVLYKSDLKRKQWCEERNVKVIELENENRDNDKKVYFAIWDLVYDWIRRKGDKRLAY